ncbi:hypothetical protein D3C72_1534240 [compost metagenome]
MGQLRQLDLQLAFMAAGALGKDIQNQGDAIDNAALQHALQIAFLPGPQSVIEDHHVGRHRIDQGRDLLDLAFAGEQRGIGTLAFAMDGTGHGDTGTAH